MFVALVDITNKINLLALVLYLVLRKERSGSFNALPCCSDWTSTDAWGERGLLITIKKKYEYYLYDNITIDIKIEGVF